MTRFRSVSSKLKRKILTQDHWLCWYCGHEIATGFLKMFIGRKAVVDHKIPVAWSGTDDEANLVAACYWCNRRKGALSVEAYREKLLHTNNACCVVFFGERDRYN